MLALSFKRMIIASDLPSFKETLAGFSENIFFENGNEKSLANVIEKFYDRDFDACEQLNEIERKFSWDKIANCYKSLYEAVL